MVNTLLISVHFHDGRYHGSGEWPPSPARLLQALVAGAARGDSLTDDDVLAFNWLESLTAPAIAAPSAFAGQSFKNFVPNNDLDAVGGDPARIGEIRAGKIIRSRTFDAAVPVLYGWTFEPGADAERHARAICGIANNLYQLGRGVDMAWATGEVADECEATSRLCGHGGVLWRPNESGDGTSLSCPRPGSLASLAKRFVAMGGRFRTVSTGRKNSQLFAQSPKPDFRQVRYNSPSLFLLFEIRNDDGFAPQPLERAVALTERIRDLAVKRLTDSAWRRDDPKRQSRADKVFVGRDSQEADKAQRIRIVPLPSTGHAQTDHAIRRVLVTVPPDCPVASGDVAWAFSGLALDIDSETGEIPDNGAELVRAGDRTMLTHYGVEAAAPAWLWRTVTPAALPERAARRRIDPQRMREEAKGGAERLRENAAAERAVIQAVRHAGIATPAQTIRVQREPFDAKGQRAEAFATAPRFAKERLWHAEINFGKPVGGPVLIGDGRYLGLGLMAPVRRAEGVFAFEIADGLADCAQHLEITRALRRAVMSRVQAQLGPRATLPLFFTGHAADGAPARSGGHEHLAFAFDAPRRRLIILSPHVFQNRDATGNERRWLTDLELALENFSELRAGRSGRLSIAPCVLDQDYDPLFAKSSSWVSLTPYRVTRHAKLRDAAAAVESDILSECRRHGLPRPEVKIDQVTGKPGAGLIGHVTLRFHSAVSGPLLLGRDRHFGGGLFTAAN
ncbi:MAG TPA: type I-U CRISPR-associated protein Csb2 [Micropepsaceae bacterium]|nr:type I-U CRISPR-associated protein Csb2 [Micropepsaceae bacterium]